MRLKEQLSATNIGFVLVCAAIACWFLIQDSSTFSQHGFMPHGHCYLWSPALVWTMVITDALIGIAYVSISLCLYVLVRRIQLPFSAMFLAFGVFIAACGATHFMSIYTLWIPDYWLDAFVKIITAVASVATALIMFPLFPKVVALAKTARLSEGRKRQLETLNEELQVKTEAYIVANRELEAFSYTVSHDLRSPLRAIDGFSQAILDEYSSQLDGDGLQYLKEVRAGAQRMGQIIDDLLDLSRITRSEMHAADVNISVMALETFAHLRTLEPDRQVEINIQSGMRAVGDRGLIRILVENLASNAWKFSSKRDIARISFGAVALAGATTYYVRDNGAGFDMKYANKLFGAFQRLHSPDEFGGTGVGLATVKRIVDRHGGSVRAESEIDTGTTVYFTLKGESK